MRNSNDHGTDSYMCEPIFTVGHSVHPWSDFVGLLQRNRIKYVLDVRSAPYSRQAPQFNMEALIANLPLAGIKYAYFGKGFGARRSEPHLLDPTGRVAFEKVRRTPEFQEAIQRVESGAEGGYRSALMCSEGNPFDCHRFAMIAYQLSRDGYEIFHILRDGTLKTQAALEEELLERYAGRISQPTMFEPQVSRFQQIEEAYRMRNLDIGWQQSQSWPAAV